MVVYSCMDHGVEGLEKLWITVESGAYMVMRH